MEGLKADGKELHLPLFVERKMCSDEAARVAGIPLEKPIMMRPHAC